MAGEVILMDLKSGTLADMFSEIKSYLELSRQKDVKVMNYYAMRFLSAMSSQYDVQKSKEQLIDATLLCYTALQEHPMQLENMKDPLTVEKLVYQIMYKAGKKGDGILALKLCPPVLTQLKKLPCTSALQYIAFGCYTVFWNTLVQQDPKKPLSLASNIHLRQVALQFLLFTDKPTATKYEKISSVLDKITYEMKTAPSSETRSSLDALLRLCSELTQLLVTKDGQEILDGDNACIVTVIHAKVMEIFLMKKAVQESEVILESFSKSIAKIKAGDLDTKTIGICQKLLNAMHKSAVYVQQSQSVSKGKSKNAGESDVIGQLEACNEDLTWACTQSNLGVMLVQTLSQCVFQVLDVYKDRKRAANGHLSSSLVLYPDAVQAVLLVMYGKLGKLFGAELNTRKKQLANEDKSPTSRLSYLQSKQVVCCSDRLVAIAANMAKTTGPLCSMTVQESQKELAAVEVFVDTGRTFEAAPLSREEHCYLGNLGYKFGRLCYQRGAYSESVPYMTVASRQFILWAKEANKQEIEKLLVYRKLEVLMTALRKLKRYDRVMSIIVEWLVAGIYPSPNAAAEIWVKVQEDRMKMDNQASVCSLYESCTQKFPDHKLPPHYSPLRLLEAEVQAAKTSKVLSIHHVISLCDLYLSLCTDPCDQSFILVEQAQCQWQPRIGNPSMLCQQAIDILLPDYSTTATSKIVDLGDLGSKKAKTEKASKTGKDTKSKSKMSRLKEKMLGSGKDPVKVAETKCSPSLVDHLARAYMMLYVTKSIDPVQMKDSDSTESSGPAAAGTDSRPSSPLSSLQEAELYGGCVSLEQEDQAMAAIDTALSLWETLPLKETAFRSLSATMDVIMVAMAAYKLAGKLSHVLRCISLVRSLSALCPTCPHILTIQTELLHLVTQCNQPHLGQIVIAETDAWINAQKQGDVVTSGSNKQQEKLAHTLYQLAKVQSLITSNKVEEAWILLDDIRSQQGKKGRTKDDLMTEAVTSDVHSLLLQLPSFIKNGTSLTRNNRKGANTSDVSETGFGAESECALEVRIRATRAIGGLVCFLLGDSVVKNTKTGDGTANGKIPGNILEKWQLLDILLSQLLATGSLLSEVGEAREARCYLQQGIRITKTFALPKRLCEFHLALAKLDALCHKTQDCAAHTHTVTYLLGSHDNIMQKSDADKPALDESMDETSGDFVIKSKSLDFEEVLGNEGHHMLQPDLCESPQRTKKHVLPTPAHWRHSSRCSCSKCSDVILQRITLMHVNMHARLAALQDETKDTRSLLKLLLANLDNISQKTVQALAAIFNSLPPLQQASSLVKTDLAKNASSTLNQSEPKVQVFCDDEARPKGAYAEEKIQPTVYHEILVTVGIQMTQLAMVDNEQRVYTEWLKKLHNLLDPKVFPHMLPLHHTRAQALYLQAMSEASWLEEPKDSELNSSILELCSNMNDMQIEEDISPQMTAQKPRFKTPVVSKTSTEVKGQRFGGAPVKAANPLKLHTKSELMQPTKLKRSVKNRARNGSHTDVKVSQDLMSKEKVFQEMAEDSDDELDGKKLTATSSKVLSKLVTPRPSTKASFGTPANMKTPSIRVWNDKVNRAPKSASNRKLISMTDSEEDDEKKKSRSAKITSSKAQKRSLMKTKPKASMSPLVEQNTGGKPTNLFKEVLKRNVEASSNVFDFAVSDPDTPPPSVRKQGKRGTGLKSSNRGRRKAEIENAREIEMIGEKDMETDCHLKVEIDVSLDTSVKEFEVGEKENCGKEEKDLLKPKRTSKIPSNVNIENLLQPKRTHRKQSAIENNELLPKKTNRGRNRPALSTSPALRVQSDRLLLPKSPSNTASRNRPALTSPALRVPSPNLSKPLRVPLSQASCAKNVETELLQPKKTCRGKSTTALPKRLTRAKTKTVEEQREEMVDSSEDSLGLSFEVIEDSSIHDSELSFSDKDLNRSETSVDLPFELMLPVLSVPSPEVCRTAVESSLHNVEVDNIIECESSPDKSGLLARLEVIAEIEECDDNGEAVAPLLSFEQQQDETFSDIEICRADSDEEKNKKKSSRSKEEREKPRMSRVKPKPTHIGMKSPLKAKEATRGKRNSGQDDESLQCDHKALLLETLSLVSHEPLVPLYRHTCHALAMHCLKKEKSGALDTVYYLAEAQATTFRHNAILNIARKLRNLEKQNISVVEDGVEEDLSQQMEDLDLTDSGNMSERQRLCNMRAMLAFDKKPEFVKKIISEIPADMSVVHVSVVTSGIGCGSDQLVISRLETDTTPLTVHLPGYATKQGEKLLSTFAAIMDQNHTTLKITDKLEWWKQREELDEKLKLVLEDMENQYLAGWKGLLLGNPDNAEDSRKLQAAAEDVAQKSGIPILAAKTLLNSWHLLSRREAVIALHLYLPSSELIQAAMDKCDMYSKTLNLHVAQRNVTVIILDKSVQHLPWENLPVIYNHPVTRLPSLYYFYVHLKQHADNPASVYMSGVDTEKTYYVLNPDGSLGSTEETFLSWFKNDLHWEGLCRQVPTQSQLQHALSDHQLYVYCGHGSGSKYLPSELLQMITCRACVLLMGCSGGRLVVEGELDPAGIMLTYFLAGSPCMMSCLWDVTDRDIDRFLEELLRSWLSSGHNTGLMDFIQQSRRTCKLPYLVGSAVVTYGFPVRINKKK